MEPRVGRPTLSGLHPLDLRSPSDDGIDDLLEQCAWALRGHAREHASPRAREFCLSAGADYRLRARGHVGGEDVVGVAVQVLAGPVVPHGGARVGVPCSNLDVAQVDTGVEHGGDEGVPQHVGMHAAGLDVTGSGQVA